jgi:hypothetical protein
MKKKKRDCLVWMGEGGCERRSEVDISLSIEQGGAEQP